jgi:hypothetical protein
MSIIEAGLKLLPDSVKNHMMSDDAFATIRDYVATATGLLTAKRQIRSITYQRRSNFVTLEVGDMKYGTVVAILDAIVSFLVCTPEHGALSGIPVTIWATDVRQVVYFDQD